MQETVKKDVVEISQDRNSQVLLGKFLNGDVKILIPVYDTQTGYRYPLVEEIVGGTSQVEPFLEKLTLYISKLSIVRWIADN